MLTLSGRLGINNNYLVDYEEEENRRRQLQMMKTMLLSPLKEKYIIDAEDAEYIYDPYKLVNICAYFNITTELLYGEYAQIYFEQEYLFLDIKKQEYDWVAISEAPKNAAPMNSMLHSILSAAYK